MTSRIEQLKQFALEDPTDAFNWYALALEYKKTDVAKAIEIFSNLLKDHVEYVPTYYQLGRRTRKLAEMKKLNRYFCCGISEARKQNDHKALHELLAAIQDLYFDSAPD